MSPKVLLFLLLTPITSQEYCPSTQGKINPTVVWPETKTATCTFSIPICTNSTYNPLPRCCAIGHWLNEPNCTHFQTPLSPCPASLVYDKALELCYTLTPPSAFPPPCPYPDDLPFSSYSSLLNTTPVWLPVRRPHPFGFLQWTEPSANYKLDFTDPYDLPTDHILGYDCIIYNGPLQYVAVRCTESYPRLCAYKKLDNRSNQLCDQNCKKSDFYPDSKCFCSGTTISRQSYDKVEFVRPYQNFVYSSVTAERCQIGLVYNGTTFIWEPSGEPISYSNWAPTVDFGSGYKSGVMTPDGWVLERNDNLSSCVLYQVKVEPIVAEIQLDLNANLSEFVIEVRNPLGLKWYDNHPFVYCFTNAGILDFVYRYDYSASMTFKAHTQGPGVYWCESYTYPGLEPVKSNEYFYRSLQFSVEFVAIIQMSYVQGTNVLSPNYTEFIRQVICLNLLVNQYLETHYICRIMKIVDLNETLRTLTINLHFTSKTSGLMPEIEYTNLKTITEDIFNSLTDLNLKLKSFKSADFCLLEQDHSSGLNWPKTARGHFAHPTEYCFREGDVVERSCEGDFDDGAVWTPFTTSCDIPKSGDLTESLIAIYNDKNHNDKLQNLTHKTEQNRRLQELDIYLVAKILPDVVVDFEMLLEVISCVMKVETSILQTSKVKTQSTDLLVSNYNLILNREFSSVSSVKTIPLIGLLTVIQPNSCIRVLLNHVIDSVDCSSGDVSNENVKSYLSIAKVNEAIVTIYQNNALFIEPNTKYLFLWPIYAVQLKDHPTVKDLNLVIYNKQKLEADFTYYCSVWMSNSWYHFATIQSDGSTIRCKFKTVGTFTLSKLSNSESDPDPKRNVTQDLDDLLNSSESPNQIITKLVNLTKHFDEFQVKDVNLIGKILEMVSNEQNVNLNELAEIVNNLHLVNQTVLQSAQRQEQSTDLILYTVDKLLKLKNTSSLNIITTENFIVLIGDLNEISGAVVYQTDTGLKLEPVGRTKVKLREGVEAGVILSEKLANQIVNNSKLIVTFHSNDALFNEEQISARYKTTRIFGVILPGVFQPYQHPVYIYHNVTASTFGQDCVHWSYALNTEVKGRWSSDESGVFSGELLRCDYYHTTHFALLLLGQDVNLLLLDFITYVNCTLSGFGLVSIIVTGILFKKWRSNPGNQILLSFVFAMSLQIATFYVSNEVSVQNAKDALLCTIVGVVLHYSLISQFCWMFIIAILQFKRFVEVFGTPPTYVLVKACICGWILPLLPVICVYALDNNNYNNSKVGLCYPSGLGLYLGVWLPIVIVVAVNLVIFCYIMYNVWHKKAECVSKESSDVLAQWRLAFLLFFMLGLTWGFGFLVEFEFGTIFIYLFTISGTLQGFVMFLFFIVFNKGTRWLYVQSLRKCCRKLK